jgi:excisionase family DNA binding protein
MPEAFLTAAEVAAWLRVNIETVYDLIAQQGLPAIRLGRCWRFQEREVRAWLKTTASRGHADTESRNAKNSHKEGQANG